MKITDKIQKSMAENWIPAIYKQKIRPLRTRSHSLEVPQKENAVEIQYSLLGIEIKVNNFRFSCPDLSTARYLRVFARLGIRDFAIPYDISRIPGIADELESSWQTLLLLLEQESRNKTPQVRGRTRSAAIKTIRDQINDIGPGPKMPVFKTSTKQRND